MTTHNGQSNDLAVSLPPVENLLALLNQLQALLQLSIALTTLPVQIQYPRVCHT